MIAWVIAAGLALLVIALVALCAAQRGEIGYLRAELSARGNHAQRIERAIAGLPEVPTKPHEADEPPKEIRVRIDAAIGSWDSAVTQAQKWEDVSAWRSDGRDWAWIAGELEKELDESE